MYEIEILELGREVAKAHVMPEFRITDPKRCLLLHLISTYVYTMSIVIGEKDFAKSYLKQ